MALTSHALVKKMIEAYGGLDRWNAFTTAEIHGIRMGATFAIKGAPGLLADFHFEMDLHKQAGEYRDFPQPGQRATFRPDRIAIENADGSVVEELLDPRRSLDSQTLETKWNVLQFVYFASYATWTYLAAPFCFSMPGFMFEDLEPVQVGDQQLASLKVRFPDYLARHSKEQTYFVGDDGLIRRHNYVAEVVATTAYGTHYYADFKQFNGITVATRHRVYPLASTGERMLEPILVAQDLEEVVFS
jgi:hypothetical protein